MRISASSFIPSLALTAVAATGATAFADAPAERAPFATMDDTGDASKADVDLGIVRFDDGESDLTIGRLDLHGQYVAPSGFGGYAGITAATILFEDDDGDGDDSGVGNLELGGLYQRALSPQFDLGFRVGMALPTATDDFGGLVNMIATSVARPSDVVAALPNTTWLRLGVSPTFHHNGLFLRADVGFDIALDGAEDFADTFAHVNLGVGYAQGPFGIAAELQNAVAFYDGDEGDDDSEWVHTAALTARYRGRVVSPFVSISTPLDDGIRGDAFGISAGLTAAF
jgi:hypothetical protein